MSDQVPEHPPRAFSLIQADLENVTAKLEETNDPNLKRELLREMRVLLQEATLAANSLC
jgi:hypothetical protein